jgi:hypothetical protein
MLARCFANSFSFRAIVPPIAFRCWNKVSGVAVVNTSQNYLSMSIVDTIRHIIELPASVACRHAINLFYFCFGFPYNIHLFLHAVPGASLRVFSPLRTPCYSARQTNNALRRCSPGTGHAKALFGLCAPVRWLHNEAAGNQHAVSLGTSFLGLPRPRPDLGLGSPRLRPRGCL